MKEVANQVQYPMEKKLLDYMVDKYETLENNHVEAVLMKRIKDGTNIFTEVKRTIQTGGGGGGLNIE